MTPKATQLCTPLFQCKNFCFVFLTTLVRLIYKNEDRDKTKDCSLVSLLNGFSEIYERFLLEKLTIFTGKVLPNLM